MNNVLKLAFIAASTTLSLPASAAIVTLDFDGIATSNNTTEVGEFYNGGISGDGNTGTNYGVTFTPNALAITSYNGANEPNPGVLYFLSGAEVTINYAAGFDTGFSFYYASSSRASITVYDGLNGTGNVLATLNLADNYQSGCGYCVWTATGVSFAGTAKSIDFAGGADLVAYDDITFGSATVGGGAVPEPATWAMMIGGFGAIGGTMRQGRRKVSAHFA